MLIDTDVLIDFMRGKNGAVECLRQANSTHVLACSAITVSELRAGMRKKEESKLLWLLENMFFLPVDWDIAVKAGDLKRLARGFQLETCDCLIAASAIVKNATLLTHNPKHYPHKELSLESAQY